MRKRERKRERDWVRQEKEEGGGAGIVYNKITHFIFI